MKFRDARMETRTAVELVCLTLSLASIFFQIWILSTSWEAYFQGHTQRLLPALIFSCVSFLVCALTAWTTGMSFMKGMDEGRTNTYHKHTPFKGD
ncbi:MAG: hypothetical protein JNN05_08780 [Candidatus Omnitrophica bacterium]|nr:hypothetical protein [Candidatus Omnitrophota bacterium]